MFRSLEDQPRALEALAYGFAPSAGYYANEPVALTGEILQRLDQLLAVQHEDHPVVFGEVLDGIVALLLCAHGLREQTLALRRLGPLLAPAFVGLGLEGCVPLAPIFQVLLDPVQYPLYGGRMTLAHHQPPLFVYPSATHSTPVSPILPDASRGYALSR